MSLDTIKAIGDTHALGVPDRTRFSPVQRYVEDVVEHLLKSGGTGGDLPDDLEQRIERVVADRLEPIVQAMHTAIAGLDAHQKALEAIDAELKRRRGGRKPKEQAT